MAFPVLNVARDCIYFRGDVPCKPHKDSGARCKCELYRRRGKRILVVKLGAMGDVVRSTSISERLRKTYPDCEITWLTNYPDVVPKAADVALVFNERSVAALMADKFDVLYNFDKDREACAVASLVKAGLKKGFVLEDGKCAPADKDAVHKFVTGVFDDESRANKKSYQEEMFEIAGEKYAGERYAIEHEEFEGILPKGCIIGLNTGGADRWTARLWPDEMWEKLAVLLKEKGYAPMFVGGAAEHEKNVALSKKTGAFYPGHFQFKKFAGIVRKCDAVVSCVTLGFHVAVAMERKVVLLNNIFNKHEFDLYGSGKIIEPPKECRCFYRSKCIYGGSGCLDNIKPEDVAKALEEMI